MLGHKAATSSRQGGEEPAQCFVDPFYLLNVLLIRRFRIFSPDKCAEPRGEDPRHLLDLRRVRPGVGVGAMGVAIVSGLAFIEEPEDLS